MSIESLRLKLSQKQDRTKTRYKYYEMKSIAPDFQISTPPQLMWVRSSLGWCGKAVDALADRLHVTGISNDIADMWNIFKLNNADIFTDAAILSALINSCSFCYIRKGDDGQPVFDLIDGGNATGTIDSATGLLREGYAVLDRDANGSPTLEAYFAPGYVDYFPANGEPYRVESGCKYVTLVPIIHRPDDKRPFGRARISRACMSIQNSALRTIKRSEVSAEFYSYPQKYVTGLAQDSEPMDKWKAAMSSMIAFEKDDDGDHPVVGQFSQQSMEPHLAQLRMFAALFAGETGLTLDDLGFATGNPSSADAIKSAHENLRMAARKAQRCFGSNFVNIGMVAACVRDDYNYNRSAFADVKIEWEPVFEPDAAMLSGIGDAIVKIGQILPEYFTEDKLKELTGI